MVQPTVKRVVWKILFLLFSTDIDNKCSFCHPNSIKSQNWLWGEFECGFSLSLNPNIQNLAWDRRKKNYSIATNLIIH